MNDLISRHDGKLAWDKWHETRPVAEHIIEDLKDLPSAQSERKRGKWERWVDRVEHSRGVEYIPRCRCSECGTEYDPNSAKFINFCPQCGADMRGEQDDSV